MTKYDCFFMDISASMRFFVFSALFAANSAAVGATARATALFLIFYTRYDRKNSTCGNEYQDDDICK